MSWKQWTAVLTVVGLGIVLQIPGHDDMEMEHSGHDAMSEVGQEQDLDHGPYRTVTLEVTGMT